MQLIVFSKLLRERSIDELIELAQEHGFAGYDLAVRPGHPVTPDNAAVALPEAARRMAAAGLVIPLVTGPTDLVEPDDPRSAPLLAAMDAADVRLLKIGYFRFDPSQGYWEQVDAARRKLARWAELGRAHGVVICYHTHSGPFLGLNGAGIMHLLRDQDPEGLAAYLDPGHLRVDGEPFPLALAMTRDYLRALSLKDVLLERVEQNGHGATRRRWVPAGQGQVDWTQVFTILGQGGFDGPLSIHCEFEAAPEDFARLFAAEVAFFRGVMG